MRKEDGKCCTVALPSVHSAVLRPDVCNLTFLLFLVHKTGSRDIQSRTAAHGAHNVVPKSLFLFTSPIFVPAPVYKDKGKTDYEGAGELIGFAFESVEEF